MTEKDEMAVKSVNEEKVKITTLEQLQKELKQLHENYSSDIQDAMGELHNIDEQLKDMSQPKCVMDFIQDTRDDLDGTLIDIKSDLHDIRRRTDNEILKTYDETWDEFEQTYHVSDTEESTDSTE